MINRRLCAVAASSLMCLLVACCLVGARHTEAAAASSTRNARIAGSITDLLSDTSRDWLISTYAPKTAGQAAPEPDEGKATVTVHEAKLVTVEAADLLWWWVGGAPSSDGATAAQRVSVQLECEESVKLKKKLREGVCSLMLQRSKGATAGTASDDTDAGDSAREEELRFSYEVWGDATEDENEALVAESGNGGPSSSSKRSRKKKSSTSSSTTTTNNNKAANGDDADAKAVLVSIALAPNALALHFKRVPADGDRDADDGRDADALLAAVTLRSVPRLTDTAPRPSSFLDRWGFPVAVYAGTLLLLWLWAVGNAMKAKTA